jgi:pentapeptide MXKDX repeat protein
MRKIIVTAAALAFLSSTAFAQSMDGTAAPAAQSGDTMSKGGDMSKGTTSKDKMSKKKTKKSAKMKSNDAK